MKKKGIILFLLIFAGLPVFSMEKAAKYPDFSYEYLGYDKFENFNRKMFLVNGALNKYAIRPVTIIWTSIIPKCGITGLKNAYNNILFPRYLISSVLQKDFSSAKTAALRFLTNSTIGVAGLFDPAKKIFKLAPVNEDMEQVLAKWKVKQGPYLVVPVINSSTPRALMGRALDMALDPTSYVGSPVIAAVKAGFTVNNASLIQPLSKTVENNYADPYDIVKKLYGLQTAILNANLDRENVLEEKEILDDISDSNVLYEVSEITPAKTIKASEFQNIIQAKEILTPLSETIKGGTAKDEVLDNDELKADIILKNFNPQNPVIDSMRTALFEIENVNKSIWSENSIWNRSFEEQIKTGSVQLEENKEKYKFRYIMQKDKTAPVAILFPSVGESIYNHHSTHFAKLFYNEGYSVIIQSSAFHFDFIKSLPESFKPGVPIEDVKYIKLATSKILNQLEEKYNVKFKDKIVMGTSYGALSTLFLANSESVDNKLNISKYISINPPVELLYAMNEIDKISMDFNKENLKEKTSITAAKILKAAEKKKEGEKFEKLPFNLNQAKLITGFVLHQKLSDLLFVMENCPLNKKTDFYEKMNNTNYNDYLNKYLISGKYKTKEDFNLASSLHGIKNYLQNSNNYRIYHTLDDYLTNKEQLKKLREYSKNKLTLIDKGAHLGFLYREEFLDDLKKEISIKQKL